MDIKGIIPLFVQLGDLQVCNWFLVCSTLRTECLLGTSSIDPYVKAIYLGLWKVSFYRTRPVAIIGSKSGTEVNTRRPPLARNTVSNKVQLSKAILILPMTQIAAQVTCKTAGLVKLQNHLRTIDRHLSIMVNVIMDCRLLVPFIVNISNFRDHTRLPKGTVMKIALTAPMAIMETSWEALTSTNDKEVKLYGEEVHFGQELESYRLQVIELLQEFKSMW